MNSKDTGNSLGVAGAFIKNSIVTGNTHQGDCLLSQSLGYNMFTEVSASCETQPSDMIGVDPQLGAFQDLFEPGRSHYPLLADSPAIDSANPHECPEFDQLGNPRVGICDRGSIEFQPIRYLSFLEGNPGNPGDGIIISSIGGLFDHWFEAQPPYSLTGIRNGLTVSAFPPLDTPLTDLMIQVNFSVEGRPIIHCSVGTAASPDQHVRLIVNGVEGIGQNFSQERLNFLVDLMRQQPGCGDVTLDQFLLHSAILINNVTGEFVQELDALAVGVGENRFP
jgi:hypothetical protein